MKLWPGSLIKECINNIFSMTDPERIITIIIKELNRIINNIAPFKIIQRRKDNQKYINEEARMMLSDAGCQLNEAIRSKDVEEWRYIIQY